MKILNTTANVSTKTPFYIQAPDLRDQRVCRWIIPSAGTVTLFGRMDANDTWLQILTSTLSDAQPVKLMPQVAATLSGIDSGTVIFHIDVECETKGLHSYAG